MSDLKHDVVAGRWAGLIKERMESGMTIKEWCAERNVSESQYYYWLKTLRRETVDGMAREARQPRFVELPAACGRQPEAPQGGPAAIIRKGDVSIEVSESAPMDFIARIVGVLAHA